MVANGNLTICCVTSSFRITHVLWNALVPGYKYYPARFKVAIPYLVASVVFHEEWLRKNLSSEHPYFKCRLYTSNVSWSDKILSGSGYNATSKMSASGLPEHARLSKDITNVEHSLGILERSLSDHSAAAEERNRELLQELPVAITEVIMQRVRIEGVQALTVEEIKNLMANQSSEIMEALKCYLNERFREPLSGVDTSDSVVASSRNADHSWEPFVWGGQFHWLPQEYTFPPMTVRQPWDAWLYGSVRDYIPPYRKISPRNPTVCSSQKGKYCKAKFVMDCLLAHVAADERLRVHKLSATEADGLFATAYSACMGIDISTMQGGSRYSKLSYISACNRIKGSRQD